ncbi:MAG: NAD(+)/NADH kinase [Ilumatobacteraceae bacterium]
MTRVLVVAHHERPEAHRLATEAATWLERHGHEAATPEDPDAAGTADLVLTLGGDGTMLRAVGLLDGAPVPLLGVNLGRLGYLTEIEADQLESALERFMAGSELGHWHLDERMMLGVRIEGPSGVRLGAWRALIEAVVE